MPVQFLPFIELSRLNGQNGFMLYGDSQNSRSGFSVSNVYDVNADGVGDMLIGAPFDSNIQREENGCSYVVFGKQEIGSGGELDLGTDGLILYGDVNEHSGFSASSAGDINDDGIADLLIGAPGNLEATGHGYVVFGKRTVYSSYSFLELTNLNGTNGFKINGEFVGDNCGSSVSSAGDVNNDGIDDLLISAPFASVGNKLATGRSYVIFGKAKIGHGGVFNLSNLNGTNGFKINGENAYDLCGNSVSGAGDVNNDGIDDLLIGAPSTSTYAGRSYVVFGNPTIGISSGMLELASLNGANGFKINGERRGDASGDPVNSIRDINGDGVNDVVIAAPDASTDRNNTSGCIYVIFGRSDIGSNGILNLTNLDGTNGFKINSENPFDNSDFSVSGAGDVNGDGIGDLLIGASVFSPDNRNAAGRSYVILGRNGIGRNGTLDLSSLNGTTGFVLSGVSDGDQSGSSVSMGDVNGDNVTDLLIGAPFANAGEFSAEAGITYVVFGSTHIPELITNSLRIDNGQTLNLNSANLNATYLNHDPAFLQFKINGLQLEQGQFEYVNTPGTPITSFFQKDVWTNQVRFIHAGSNLAPSYSVSVNDGVVTTSSSPAMVTFYSDTSRSIDTQYITIGAIVAGTLLITIIGTATVYFPFNAKQKLKQAIVGDGNASVQESEYRQNVFAPIAKKIYAQIKISGFLGYLGQQTAESFIIAIQALLEELQKLGVDLDLEKMTPENRERLFKEIIKQIRLYTIPQRGLCSASFCNFFKAEITPVQIGQKAGEIAKAVEKEIKAAGGDSITHHFPTPSIASETTSLLSSSKTSSFVADDESEKFMEAVYRCQEEDGKEKQKFSSDSINSTNAEQSETHTRCCMI